MDKRDEYRDRLGFAAKRLKGRIHDPLIKARVEVWATNPEVKANTWSKNDMRAKAEGLIARYWYIRDIGIAVDAFIAANIITFTYGCMIIGPGYVLSTNGIYRYAGSMTDEPIGSGARRWHPDVSPVWLEALEKRFKLDDMLDLDLVYKSFGLLCFGEEEEKSDEDRT